MPQLFCAFFAIDRLPRRSGRNRSGFFVQPLQGTGTAILDKKIRPCLLFPQKEETKAYQYVLCGTTLIARNLCCTTGSKGLSWTSSNARRFNRRTRSHLHRQIVLPFSGLLREDFSSLNAVLPRTIRQLSETVLKATCSLQRICVINLKESYDKSGALVY